MFVMVFLIVVLIGMLWSYRVIRDWRYLIFVLRVYWFLRILFLNSLLGYLLIGWGRF